MADYLNIAGRIKTTAADGVALEAQEVKDLEQNKFQTEINADVQTELADRYTKQETYSKQQLDNLITSPDVNYVSVVATDQTTDVTDILPASGEADTIYRVGNWNGSQYDTTVYSLYAWNGSAYVCLAVRSFVGEVYDISVNHPDGQGNPTPYADLAAALGTNGANIPADIRHGGMRIQFIKGTVLTSDNKYVSYMYIGTSTVSNDFINVDNWEKIVLEEDLDNAVSKWYLNDDKGLSNKIREVYLEGLDTSEEYQIYYQYSSGENKYYINVVYKNTTTAVAGWKGTTTDGIINLTQRNSSGVTGKVLLGGLSADDTVAIYVDIDNDKVTDSYYSLDIVYAESLIELRSNIQTNANNIQANTNNIQTNANNIQALSNRCDDIVGKKDIMYVFSANSSAYTFKYVNFNFVNGGIYKIKITYPTGVNTSTKFSVRGENGSGVVKDNIGTGTSTRTIDYTHESDAGKTLCLSILDAIVAETSFDVTVEMISGTNLLSLQKDIDATNENVNDLSEGLENFEKNFCSPVPSTELVQGSYYDNILGHNIDRLSSKSYYLIPKDKKVLIYSLDTSVCKNLYRLQLYDVNKSYISGSGVSDFAEGPFDVSLYDTAVYYRFSVLCDGDTTPSMASDIVCAINGYDYAYKEQLSELETVVNNINEEVLKIDEELFFAEVPSYELIQGSYYNNSLSDNPKRVSSGFIKIYPNDTLIAIKINNPAFTGKFRLTLFDSSKTYIQDSGIANAASSPFDISSWTTAKYYKFTYFNDVSVGGNDNDITPSDCDGVFSVKRFGIWDTIESIDKRVDILEENAEIIAPDYKTEAVRITGEVEASNTDLRLLVFTDPHSFEKYKYQKYAQVNELGGIDGIVGLGDYQNYTDASKADCIKGITNMLNAAGRGRNCFYAIGNHDASCCLNAEMNRDGYKVLSQSNIMTKQESWRTMQYHLNGLVEINETDPYGGYFYYDFTVQKIRLIVINASDVYESDGSLAYKYNEGVIIKQQQVDWFANKALDFSNKADASEWSVIVCGHWYFSAFIALLNAAKNGSSINSTYSYTRRFTYDEQTQQWGSPLIPESVSVNKDFSAQGPINVIGYFFGHTHCDESNIRTGINMLQFVCDNGYLNHIWKATLPSVGLSAGNYYFSMESGTIIQINLDNDLPTAVTVGYNHYFNSSNWTEVSIYDANGQVIWKNNCQKTEDPQGTEITGFVDAETTLVSKEKCSVVCIDKANRKILAYPYGSASYREISY